ncbi:MAG: 30S ribosome-binding factor RbfA [Candidatus Aminicenantes bacterium]|nr:30S ribosome-binding factor RbfA [Candidatus Aminicenantes bacterium]
MKTKEERRRPKRVSGLIHHHISQCLIQEVQPLFSSLVTVIRVEMTADLLTARVFLTVLGPDDPTAVLEVLDKKKSYLRRSVASAVNLKYNPELFFELDLTPEWESRLNRLIKQTKTDEQGTD